MCGVVLKFRVFRLSFSVVGSLPLGVQGSGFRGLGLACRNLRGVGLGLFSLLSRVAKQVGGGGYG